MIRAALASVCSAASAQTLVTGSNLAMQSQGSPMLGSAGFVGTYLVVPAGGATVNFTINANQGASGAGVPHMQLVVADTSASFNVSSTSATDYTTQSITLPQGTYVVRDERDFTGNVNVSRALDINSLSVNTVSGATATFSNTNDGTTALAAADTYITHFRQGTGAASAVAPGNIPLLAGTQLNAHLARIGFNFGTAVPGTDQASVDSYLGNNSTPQQLNYQAHLNQNFNTVVPENAGKWEVDEATRNVTTLGPLDTTLSYAQSHHMQVRMHNLIWQEQQPAWAKSLLTQAAAGDIAAKNDLRADIDSRINYYVGTGAATDRAAQYSQMDVYNESYHSGALRNDSYWAAYSPTGIADIFRQVHSVAPNVQLMTNEYNVFANEDNWGKAYQQNIEAIRSAGLSAGFGDVVSGIGAQYYANDTLTDMSDPNAAGASITSHNPARMMQVIQNLSTEGLPITLTEFGGVGGGTPANVAGVLRTALRIAFGNPSMQGFMMWGFEAENGGGNMFASGAALYTLNTADWSTWTITEAGKAWQDQLGIQDWDGNPANAWTTPDQIVTVDASGKINISGFYGDYNIGNQSAFSNLSFAKGTSGLAMLSAPPNWSIWDAGASGAWSGSSSWSGGSLADSSGQTAYFGPSSAGAIVNVDAPRTVGMLAFNSESSYMIAGDSTLTLRGFNNPSGHVASIFVAAGNHRIEAPVALADDTTITVVPATSTLTLTHLQPTNASLSKEGAGMLTVNAVQAAGLSVSGGTLTIASKASGGGISVVNSLDIAGTTDNWTATLDLTDESLIVGYSGVSPLSRIQNQIKSGANGAWTGMGITSSSAASAGSEGIPAALGFAEASALGLSSFGGEAITGPSVVVRYTLCGDANLDGVVNAIDFNRLASGFGAADSTWIGGDFNYDGAVNTADFDALAMNFNHTLPAIDVALASPVPEPCAAAMLLCALLLPPAALRKRVRAVSV
jgi:GH35 family endo-1,4-beta-xylanase